MGALPVVRFHRSAGSLRRCSPGWDGRAHPAHPAPPARRAPRHGGRPGRRREGDGRPPRPARPPASASPRPLSRRGPGAVGGVREEPGHRGPERCGRNFVRAARRPPHHRPLPLRRTRGAGAAKPERPAPLPAVIPADATRPNPAPDGRSIPTAVFRPPPHPPRTCASRPAAVRGRGGPATSRRGRAPPRARRRRRPKGRAPPTGTPGPSRCGPRAASIRRAR